MGLIHELATAARRYRQVKSGPPASLPVDPDRFRVEAARSLTAGPVPGLAGFEFIDIPADTPPWIDTGVDIRADEQVSVVSAGNAWLSRPLDVWVGPQFQLWMRIGENGQVFNGTRTSHTFAAAEGGRLYLGNAFPGQWGDRQGRLSTSINDFEKQQGLIRALVLRWNADPKDGLRELAARGDTCGLFAQEVDRLESSIDAPEGWNLLWFLGNSEIYRAAETKSDNGEECACIRCHTHENVGILQKDLSLPLTPETRLGWEWCVDKLPSQLPEDVAFAHDYLSLAVEFNNGRDITYYWSRELPVGKGYWCPLPTWKDREFHVVIRSGEEGLGQWHAEERNLYEDYRHYMGTPPARIVRVWLISVSLFQRGEGIASYRKIELGEPGSSVSIL